MTRREFQLRSRIDSLTDQRDKALKIVKALVGERERKTFNLHCPWCGRPCYGSVCPLCRDLEDIYTGTEL